MSGGDPTTLASLGVGGLTSQIPGHHARRNLSRSGSRGPRLRIQEQDVVHRQSDSVQQQVGAPATPIPGLDNRRTGARRRYPHHFCAFEKCCYKFSDQGPLFAKSFEHLPVCHATCFEIERDRLRSAPITQSERRVSSSLCHRECYMRALLQAKDPSWQAKDIVPRNRTIKELLGRTKLHHMRDRYREKRAGHDTQVLMADRKLREPSRARKVREAFERSRGQRSKVEGKGSLVTGGD